MEVAQMVRPTNVRPIAFALATLASMVATFPVLGFQHGDAHGIIDDERRPELAVEAYTVFRRHCLKCHNARFRDAGIDLMDQEQLHRDPRGLVAPRDEGGARDLLQSRIWNVLVVDREMPPYDEEPLMNQEIDVLRRWLLAGAPVVKPVAEKGKEGCDDEK